jgi:hypothetical protein
VLPVQRGGGLQQWGMSVAEHKVGGGDWVHVFPEGARSYNRQVGASTGPSSSPSPSPSAAPTLPPKRTKGDLIRAMSSHGRFVTAAQSV